MSAVELEGTGPAGKTVKSIVVPGEPVDDKVTSFAFREKGAAFSMVLGLRSQKNGLTKVVPLHGKYLANPGDLIIGIVSGVKHGGCVVDINSPYEAFLRTEYEGFRFGDIISAKVYEVNEVREASLGDDRRLTDGEVIEISPVRVMRVIGKDNSMLNLLREKTKTMIFVGKNGRVWLKGGDIQKAKEAVFKIEREAHSTGLTKRMEEFFGAANSALAQL